MTRLFRFISFLVLVSTVTAAGWYGFAQRTAFHPCLTYSQSSPDALTPYIKANTAWTPADFDALLAQLNDEQLLNVLKSLELVDADATVAALAADRSDDIRRIKKDFLWESSNVFSYVFSSADEIEYHETTQWVAQKFGIDEKIVASASTFELERHITQQWLAKIWDELSPDQRHEVLKTLDADEDWDPGLLTLSGSAALASLATTVHFAGFAFYTTMSVILSQVAGFFGLTLPFSVYTSASTAVAFLSGPIGWTFIAIGTLLGAILYFGSADEIETAAAIVQIHLIKAQVLETNMRQLVPIACSAETK